VKLRVSEEYEDVGNFVYRLSPKELAQVFESCGTDRWSFKRHLIYYQPWTFRIYKMFEPKPLFWVFRTCFHFGNWLFGRWGNSLKAVVWKQASHHSRELSGKTTKGGT